MTPSALTTPAATGAAPAPSAAAARNTMLDPAELQDRFLKLLVAQLKNQDPMNPMDNAQMTSQMAQINTVTGIERLNTTVAGITAQVASMQLLQGATLVGREVLLPGDTMVLEDGTARGGFSLSADASNVRVDALSAGGRVVASQPLGALGAGRHEVKLPLTGAHTGGTLRLRVVAEANGQAVAATPFAREKVAGVSAPGGVLQLQLGSGRTVSASEIDSVL